MNLLSLLKELGIPYIGFMLFFVYESKGQLSEKFMTISVLFLTILTELFSYHHNEWLLFIIGLAFGIIIEVGLRHLGHQQVWKHASFFGVPYWLPLIWGFGFIIITRLGILILGLH